MSCVPQTSAEFLEAFGQYHVFCAIHRSGGAPVCMAGTIDEGLQWTQEMNDRAAVFEVKRLGAAMECGSGG
jgi:hypothetical protein